MRSLDMTWAGAAAEGLTVVGQLQLWDRAVGLDVTAGDVEQAFLGDFSLPGFVVQGDGPAYGVLCRRTLLTALSQPFGREVFIRRPLRELVSKMDMRPLILSADTRISTALRRAMIREEERRFAPCLVETGDRFGLLDMHELMFAQTRQLEAALLARDQFPARINPSEGRGA